jgi:hypothetical protein
MNDSGLAPAMIVTTVTYPSSNNFHKETILSLPYPRQKYLKGKVIIICPMNVKPAVTVNKVNEGKMYS